MNTALANLLDSLEAGGKTARAIVERIAAKESERDALGTKVASLEARPKLADVVPSHAVVSKHVEALGNVLALDIERGRAWVERYMGRVVLTPTYEGPRPRYRASGRFAFDLGESPRFEGVAGARKPRLSRAGGPCLRGS